MAETSLLPVEQLDPVKVFVQRDTGWIKKTIEDGVAEMINGATVKTATGRQKIKSAAYQVARSKTLFDKMGKDFTAKLREELNQTNAARKEIVDWCDAKQAETRKPLTEWEEAEKVRQAKHESNIEMMKALVIYGTDENGIEYGSTEMRLNLESLHEDFDLDWEDYTDEAESVKADCIEKLTAHIAAREKYEAEQAELARLRQEAEERKAKEEAERMERERKEREERIAREAAERAINQERERAAKAEQERLAKEAAEKAEAEKKAANKRHRAKINKEAIEDLVAHFIKKEDAENIVAIISSGDIRHITINY